MGKKLEAVKDIGGIIIGSGVGCIVTNIVKNNTSEEDGKIKKFTIWAGGLILAGIAADKAITYFRNKVDEAAASIKKPEEEKEI
jgi:hypothetical protein